MVSEILPLQPECLFKRRYDRFCHAVKAQVVGVAAVYGTAFSEIGAEKRTAVNELYLGVFVLACCQAFSPRLQF